MADRSRSLLSPATIKAISEVILVNDDICTLFEKRGVTREEMMEVFRLAEVGYYEQNHED